MVFIYAFAGWLLCAVVMFAGMKVNSLQNALIIHAVAAPLIFAIITKIYLIGHPKISAVKLAITFTGFVIFMDIFVVAMLINKSFAMFSSILGAWLPFGFSTRRKKDIVIPGLNPKMFCSFLSIRR
jgi:hypothetical protein